MFYSLVLFNHITFMNNTTYNVSPDKFLNIYRSRSEFLLWILGEALSKLALLG